MENTYMMITREDYDALHDAYVTLGIIRTLMAQDKKYMASDLIEILMKGDEE